MKRETTVILAALGAIPLNALAQDVVVQSQQALALNERTISIVQSLIANNALYANREGTELRVRASALDDEMLAGLSQSGQAKVDEASGDYVMDSKFAAALAGSRILQSRSPQTVSDVLLLLKLEQDLKSEMGVELASFHSTPFF